MGGRGFGAVSLVVVLLVSSLALSNGAMFDLGEVALTDLPSSLYLASEHHKTDVSVSVGPVSAPTVRITVLGDNIPSGLTSAKLIERIEGWVHIKDIYSIPPEPVATPGSAPSSAPGTPSDEVSSANQLISSISLVLMAVAVSLTREKSLALAALFALALAVPVAFAPGPASLHINVVLPSSWTATQLRLRLAAGSLTASSALALASADLDLCSLATTDTTVSIESLWISDSLSICTRGILGINALRQSANRAALSLESTASTVTAVFPSGFAGSLSLEGSPLSFTGNCSLTASNSTYAEGLCGSGSATGSLVVRAASAASIAFAVPCSSPSGGGSLDSNSMPTNRPGYSRKFTAPDFEGWNNRGNYGFQSNETSTPGEIQITVGDPTGSSKVIWLFTKKFIPALNLESQYSFAVQNSASSPLAVTKVSFAIFEGPKVFTSGGIPETYHTDHALWADDASSGAATFSLPRAVGNGFLALRVELATTPSNGQKVIFSKIALEIPACPYPTSRTLVTTPSTQWVTIPKMPSALDPTGTDCPHSQSGLSEWNDPTTWGGSVPSPSGTITVPVGKKVIISSQASLSAGVYSFIHVPEGAELIFGDSDINIDVGKGIFVEGALRIGAPTCRLTARIQITFHGSKTTADDICAGCGSKGLVSSSAGLIDIHGYQYNPTWTRLSSTVWAGDDLVFLQDPVNWEIGQQLAVTTTIYKDDLDPQNEVRTIVRVSTDKKVVQVDRAFDHTHYGGAEYQAEVALLSRRIVLQGAEDSEAERFGGHMMLRGLGRISGTQFYHMGQYNTIARYPIHFHLVSICPECFARDNAVYKSYFRCAAIHQSHNITITRNVAFDVWGHCYYFEEGMEENNTLSYNFGGLVRAFLPVLRGSAQVTESRIEGPDNVLPADFSAAAFYITNAYNYVVGNAASGGWAGFSYPNLKTPIGMAKDIPFIPEKRKTLLFDGNTVHSSGYYFEAGGGCIYVGGKLIYADGLLKYDASRDSRDTSTDPWNLNIANEKEITYFTNTKTFLCEIGLSHWGERVEVSNFEAHDARRLVQIFGSAMIHKALYNAQSNNPVRFEASLQGFQSYDTWVRTIVSDVTFQNIPQSPWVDNSLANLWAFDNRGLITMSHSDSQKPQGIISTIGIKWVNVPETIRMRHKLIRSGSGLYYAIMDWDGSFSGWDKPAMLGSCFTEWWKYDDRCLKREDWGFWVCDWLRYRGIANLNIYINCPGCTVQPYAILPDNDAARSGAYRCGNVTLFGPGIPTGVRTVDFSQNPGIAGPSGLGWFLFVEGGPPAAWQINPSQVPKVAETFVIFAVQYPAGSTFEAWFSGYWIQNMGGETRNGKRHLFQATSFSEVLDAPMADKFFFDGTHFYVKIQNPQLRAEDHYTRHNATVYIQDVSFTYNFQATCPGGCSQPSWNSVSFPNPTWPTPVEWQ